MESKNLKSLFIISPDVISLSSPPFFFRLSPLHPSKSKTQSTGSVDRVPIYTPVSSNPNSDDPSLPDLPFSSSDLAHSEGQARSGREKAFGKGFSAWRSTGRLFLPSVSLLSLLFLV
ncbi:hypothetical protein QJS04_geneDACA022932 [Acorus gramineus]|uniref:Uncharacterized protein n=1 Tax=Acorus gramineus TaxID=55184 RepID=A0AAV9AJ68_ACOGR|nr:hypothetical protein QJS04_geneDACA022932 [Acorus gramineus]